MIARRNFLYRFSQRLFFGATFVASLAVSFSASAETLRLAIFDFDGNIVENAQTREGAFNTDIIIYRIEQRMNLIQELPQGPKEVRISQQDYQRIFDYMGAGEGRPGAINREVELTNGSRIRPGQYYIRYPDSYQLFREAPAQSGRNYLLESFIEAEKRSPEGKWKGRMWDLFVELCKTKEGAEKIAISTARGHSKSEWSQFFDHLIKKKYIKFAPSLERVYNVSRPEFDRYGGGGAAFGGDIYDIAVRKTGLLAAIYDTISRVAPTPGERHALLVSDDERKIIESYASLMQKLAFSQRAPIDLFLHNSGIPSQLRLTSTFQIAGIEPGGIFRSMTLESFYSKIGATLTPKTIAEKPAAGSLQKTCESLFTGAM